MLKRKAIASIKNWVNTKNKKCLVVQGARQTGKTYIIERFAEDNYEELLEINFKQMVSAVDIFSGDLTVDNMVMAMRTVFRIHQDTIPKEVISHQNKQAHSEECTQV